MPARCAPCAKGAGGNGSPLGFSLAKNFPSPCACARGGRNLALRIRRKRTARWKGAAWRLPKRCARWGSRGPRPAARAPTGWAMRGSRVSGRERMPLPQREGGAIRGPGASSSHGRAPPGGRAGGLAAHLPASPLGRDRGRERGGSEGGAAPTLPPPVASTGAWPSRAPCERRSGAGSPFRKPSSRQDGLPARRLDGIGKSPR